MSYYGESVQEDYSSETFQEQGFGGEETVQDTQETEVVDTDYVEPDGQVFESQTDETFDQVTETQDSFF
ncbi:hypothetical protein EVJ58_g3020 [Rhodofomes roseus]|uniref:Uncharacterized protein n=1 Tax=Rhodofomes roseus TaxID=34475 RepID=A0A4Y9YMT9_9APHY|nr:hypothetical protein EVJ58_g3020 [Rhodofomes roseus]